ncbi:MAG: translesion DNA synthesis-associated protein ImuA [Pseudomonadales bacterium]
MSISSARPAKPQAILNHPGLWQAGQLSAHGPTITSGYPELDDPLLGGWPTDGLTELMLDAPGIGELQLLMPAMKALSQSQERWIVWINPPHRPCASTLRSYGIDIDKILLIHPKTPEEALWAMEKAVQSGSSAMALAWLDERQLSIKNSRRLQLAAKRGQCLSCLFRPRSAATRPSMASVRLQLAVDCADGSPQGLQVNVCKRRGGWPLKDLSVALQHPPIANSQAQKTIQEQLLLWRDLQVQSSDPQALTVAPEACTKIDTKPRPAPAQRPPMLH